MHQSSSSTKASSQDNVPAAVISPDIFPELSEKGRDGVLPASSIVQ